ncbi:chemotaxis protein CheW [Sulfurimonas sp.]
MTASVLEFRLNESSYCFNTLHVEYVFELESYQTIGGYHECVVGLTRYNDDVLTLVDTANLYSGDLLDMSTPKNVVVFVDENKKRYGLLVDEILKIDEIESVKPTADITAEEMIINHYKDRENNFIVSEISPLPLFQKYNVPAIAPKKISVKESVGTSRVLQSYLLFRVAEKKFAVNTHSLKEVLESAEHFFEISAKDGITRVAMSVRDEVLYVTTLGDNPTCNEAQILVVESEGVKFGICVDEIEDIEFFEEKKNQNFQEAKSGIEGFYNFRGDVVGIIDLKYFLKALDIEILKNEDKDDNKEYGSSEKFDYLLFFVAGKKYSIDMLHVRQVVETESLSKTQSSSIVGNKYVEFLTTWNHKAVEILRLDKELGELKKSEDSETIFIEVDGEYIAFMVDEIDNIVYLDAQDISEVVTQKESIINGAILYNKEVIFKINPKYITILG